MQKQVRSLASGSVGMARANEKKSTKYQRRRGCIMRLVALKVLWC